jgi:hypothetical protein
VNPKKASNFITHLLNRVFVLLLDTLPSRFVIELAENIVGPQGFHQFLLY